MISINSSFDTFVMVTKKIKYFDPFFIKKKNFGSSSSQMK